MKKNIAVIFGGCSDEYEVSLKSASAVIKNINKGRYNIFPVGITREGEWFYYTGSTQNIEDGTWQKSTCFEAFLSPDRLDKSIYINNNDVWERIKLDLAFPIMHGKYGEDGRVQGLIELAGIPLIGCGTLCSALGMDKHKSHMIIHAAGIKTPSAYLIEKRDSLTEAYCFIKEAGKAVVKPVCSGSSLGVSIIESPDGLECAVKEAFKYDEKVLIEEFIEGNEVGCAIIGSDNLIIGEVDEVELGGADFDFSEKYSPKNSSIHIPVNASRQKQLEIKTIAAKIYKELGCSGFARIDMFLSPNSEIVFNEVNTIPGFTENSRFPNMLRAAGYTMKEIINLIIDESYN